MVRSELPELAAFATVVEERSFTRAAARLGVSQSALSHSMRGLEKRMGVHALHARHAASQQQLQELRCCRKWRLLWKRSDEPLRKQCNCESVLQAESDSSSLGRPQKMVLMPKLSAFTRKYPEIVLEATSSNDPVDLVPRAQDDAGVQLGEYIQRDMIAVRVTRKNAPGGCWLAGLFPIAPVRKHPQDLKDHLCIGVRFTNGMYRWEFEGAGRRSPLVLKDQFHSMIPTS